MPFNVPEEEKPAFNKKVQESLGLLAQDIGDTLGRVKSLQPQTLVDAYNQPVQAPVEDQLGGDMVYITPEQQAITDIVGAEVDSLRNDAGEIASSPLEVFSKPLDANKVKALGFVDSDGNPTEKGELFFNLKESGVFNEDGTINEKGQAYLTPISDIGKEENLKAFQILWDDEVIRPNATFGEIASNTGKFVVDAALGGATRIGQEAQSFWYNSQTWDSALGRTDLRPQELRDKMTASGLGLVEGAVENLAGWAGIADIGSAWIGKKLYDVLPAGMEEEAEQALYAARQRQWQTQQDIANLSTGEIAEAVLGMDNAVAEAESAKSRIGKEEFDKQYGQTSAFSQLALDPTNAIPASIAVKAARTAPLANRVAITAQKRMASIAAQDLAIAEAQTAIEAANAVLKKEAATVSVANRLASDISTRAGASPELVARANQASQVASRISDSANQIRSTLPTVTAELEGLVAKRNSLATRIPEAYSQKVLKTMELGRQMRAMPAKAVGATLERVGDTISKTDTAVTNFLQERGLDQMYTAAVGAAGVVGLAGNPIIGTLGAGAAALKTGKVLSNYGKLFRYVGKEMENVRGQIPFWKRVAAHTAPGSLSRGFAHTFNMLDLGGVTSDTIRRAGRGIAAAAPTDLMFEYLSDGADMRPETLYQAGAESFFIGGSFAAGGGAFMGTKKRMRELSIGDELNFRRDLADPRQKALFEAIPAGTRRAISTYAIANPTLNYIFKDSGASRYDPNTNTAVINVNSTNPIKALVAHETLHHTVIKNNMETGISALFLGDTKNNTVGGLFRSRDGKLDPNFEAFRDGYYKRLGVDGMSNAERDAIYPLDKIAVEYFIEKHADQYATMAESGELGAIASSGAARRKLGSILETVLPRIPVLKDLHFKSGGMIDKNGAWVTGNGILDAEGVKRDPITSKMFRDMNRRSAGLVPGQFDPLMSDKPDSGAPILLNPADGIDAELLHPLVQVDDANKPIMKDGKPVALDRATELSRALAGLTAKEVLQRKRSENYAPEKGEAYVDDEGQFQPGWLSNDVLTEIFAKNNYNPEQKRIIREMNKLIRKGAGDRVVMINFPDTTRNKAGKVVYKPQGATLRDTVPVAVTISKDGNMLFGLMSVTKLHENIQKRSQDRRGKKLYGGNVDLILRDTQAMMDYHKQGVDSIEFFKQKYGAVEADERKKFINTMFGLLNQKEQAVLNPILLEDGVKSRDNVYRTYRADRVSKAVPMSPDEYPAMPFSYEAVSAVRMPEQRQMPEVSPEDLNPVANKQEAQGLWADGKRMFALNEMDEKLIPITSNAMLESYPADAIGWMEPEAKTRLMPEKIGYKEITNQIKNFPISKNKEPIPNVSSIKSSLDEFEEMGTRDIPIDFIIDTQNKKYPTYFSGGKEKTLELAESIKKNGIQSPMILVWENSKYPYVLEGSSRYDALRVLNAKGEKLPETVPALTIVDTSKDLRFMPEPLPANYQSSRDTTFLYQSIGPDGIVNLNRPIKSTEALPTISTRHEYPVEDFTVSKFDKRASILYAKNKNGEDVSFKFDPQLMKQPEFADFDDLYDGAVVQLAMADRHGATDGDMGGHSFPDLKVNQDIIVDDGNGNEYKLVWSNNAWGPVKNMSTKAQKYGATTLLTYNMDQHAHDSNTRTVRIFSNEIANSNLSAKDQSTLLIVMNVALKKAQSSANKQDLRALLKTKKDLIDLLKKDDKAISQAKGYVGKKPLSPEERLALENEIEGNQKDIDDENKFLEEALGTKLAGNEEVKVDTLFRNYQNKRRAYEKTPTSETKKKAMVEAEKELKAYQKTKEFKKAEGLLPSRELDKFSNTFKGRKSLILAVKNKEASVKWHGFDSQKISQAIGDQLTGDSLHIVSSVELSSDPNFKAVYLGDDPREIARMSPSEQKAAQQLKSNPNFVAHEAYLWSMLGPAESKHIYNTNQRSVLESFPDFVNEYSNLPVKPGKLKLNDPNSKASEFNIVNTIRDQSKIGIVFRAEKGKNKETKPQKNGRQ